jgi:acetyl-CoA carboxylase biotin carboxyl carrier protein
MHEMNIKEVKELIQEILQSDISEFELEHTGTKLKLCRGYGNPQVTVAPAAPPPVTQLPLPRHVHEPAPPAPAAAAAQEIPEAGLHIITSPIVGTFYRASSPGAEPYVKVGQNVEEGTILCVVEAMKLMNEIPSDVAGEITRIYVENSHPVEFGQKLFAIRPRK